MKSFVLLVLALSALVCQAEDWTHFHGPNGNGKTPVFVSVDTLLRVITVPLLSTSSGPATLGDSVFLATQGGFCCLSLRGDSIWRAAGSFENVPGLLGSSLVVTSNASLWAFNYDGSSIGSITVSNPISTPVIWRDTIFVTEGISVWKISPSGDTIWHRECSPGFQDAAPAVDDSGRVFVVTVADPLGFYDYRVYGFNQVGEQIFFYEGSRFPLVEPKGNQVTPMITPLGVVFATYPDPIWFNGCYLVRFAGGATRWEGTMWHTSAACDVPRSRIYHVDDNVIVARDLTGNEVWRSVDLGTISWSSPAVDGEGRIFVGTDMGVFYVLGSNGVIQFRYDTGSGILTNPAIAFDGSVLIASTSGRLYCFGSKSVGVQEPPKTKQPQLRLSYFDALGRRIQSPRRGVRFLHVSGGITKKTVKVH